jgi:sulfate permease, SulP family
MRIGINPFPFWTDLKNYRFDFFRRDSIAALSVALLALPQAMAYAFVADLPASAGIWAAIFGTIFTASFGQSRFLVSGTTNVVAILIQTGTSEILSTYYRSVEGVSRDILALDIVLQLVFLVGIFQIIISLLGLGRLTQFASRSVVMGYLAGAALTILVTQLFPFFGVKEPTEYQPLYVQILIFIAHFTSLHLPTTFLALGALGLFILFYSLSEKIPTAAIVFVATTLIVAIFGLKHVALLENIAPFKTYIPRFAIPSFEMRILGEIVPLAFAISLFAILESTTIGKLYATVKDPPYNDNQEIYGLGVSNFLSSFLGAMPSSGSFSRTALNQVSRAKTRFSSVFSGVLVMIFIVLFGFFVGKIPVPALSALMIFTAWTMVDFRYLSICLKATKGDAFVVVITFLSSLFFTLDVVLYIGIALSIALYLKQAASPSLVEYSFNPLGKLRPIDSDEERLDPRICIFQAEGELFFGASDPLELKLRQIAEDENIKVVILQLLNTRYIDASVCLALENVHHYLLSTQRHMVLAGVGPEILSVLKKTGLLAAIGDYNCFPARGRLPSESTRLAYAYAKNLINS